ncbi:unnamed protein product [Blepharisma stoltei]|uniref:Uncharacterized protein n=1 Tax=Blepharisma stoltei TaxID=1481888 RepID=A0AAU9IB17_9CILI|nr:unnamed protein product [Blepharisma stoltei]
MVWPEELFKRKIFTFWSVYEGSGHWNLLNTQFSFGNYFYNDNFLSIIDLGSSHIVAPETAWVNHVWICWALWV